VKNKNKMCGILFSENQPPSPIIDASCKLLRPRGPDDEQLVYEGGHLFAFFRLAINDLTTNGMQPFVRSDFVFICNGEIYNSEHLRSLCPDAFFVSTSDCEVVPHIIHKYGIDAALQMLHGVFAFVYFDRVKKVFYVARDAIGVKSLYSGSKRGESNLLVSSEMKALHPICDDVSMFPAGHYYSSEIRTTTRWCNMDFNPRISSGINKYVRGMLMTNIEKRLREAVRVRLETSDRQVGCFLSGGLDSSLVAAIASEMYKQKNKGKIKTFSVGMENATDLLAAKQVAEHIGSEHHELIVTPKEMLDAIPRVIQRIESYDTTTVRASTGMVLLSDYIRDNFPTTVLFSGEGADELSGSYKYFDNAPDPQSMQDESVRLVNDLQYFDVLRCDKSVSGSSLEARTPFFDMNFVNYYMRLDPVVKSNAFIEKALLRETFSHTNLLPHHLLYRRKEAFSDGCSSLEKPWFKIIQDHCENLISDDMFQKEVDKISHNKPESKEALWFRLCFEKYYPGRGDIVPYLWLPKWTTEKDPSARLL
jgi:asparagine synthase (glutamine-hydrolysing)